MLLSVLDQSPIRKDGTAADAVADTIALAKACDRLGYHRYWLAEHHNSNSFAGSCPEILIGRVAQETKHLRVGSGGVMLTHYSPLKIAEQFRMLEVLNPGRIDLGLGRAPGSDQMTARALQSGPQAWPIDVFPSQVQLLRQFLDESAGKDALPLDDAVNDVGVGLGAGFGRTCGVGSVGACSATTTGGRDSGTSVDGPWSVAVNGADTSSPGANALFASNGTRGSRFHNAAR